MKRVSLHGSSRFDEYPMKKRAVAIMEKVDAIAYPYNDNMGEKYMHYSVTNCRNQLYESRKEKSSDVTTHVPETIEEPGPYFEDDYSLRSDAEYVEDLDEIQSHMFAGPDQSDDDTLCIVAESLDVEDISKEAVAERIHRASVGGLHALLSMAKYDASIGYLRCA